MPVHPQAQEIIDLFDAFGLEQLTDLPLAELRSLTSQLAEQGPRPDVAEVHDLEVPGATAIPLRIYRPLGSSADDELPVLVWFHGGGWTIGSIEGSDGTCRSLANRCGAAVVSVGYRLCPEHPYPAAVDDCWAATGWIASHGGELGVDTRRLAVGGDSAGGNLAAVISLMARDAGAPTIGLQVLVYPAVDAHMTAQSIDTNGKGYLLSKSDMEWFYDQYGLGDAVDPSEWRLSPALAERHDGLPPAYVCTAEFDPLRDEGEAYAETLRAAGVDVEYRRFDGMVHGFFGMFGQVDAAITAHDEVAEVLRRTL